MEGRVIRTRGLGKYERPQTVLFNDFCDEYYKSIDISTPLRRALINPRKLENTPDPAGDQNIPQRGLQIRFKRFMKRPMN